MKKYIDTESGLRLWTETFGNKDNPAILLIMGAMNQGVLWSDEFCETLAESGLYVIRYDHRDTGKSSVVDFQSNPYSLSELKQDALDILADHNIEQAYIMGLSMGGYIAQLLAIENPGRVSGLVLLSTSADHRPYMAATSGQSADAFLLPPPTERFLDYIHKTAANPPTTPEAIEENILNGWRVTYADDATFPKERVLEAIRLSAERAASPTSAMNHALAVLNSPDRLDLVEKIKAPTLVIHGKYDACLPLAHGEYLADKIPNAKLVVLDIGHAFQWSKDEEVAVQVTGFISTLNR